LGRRDLGRAYRAIAEPFGQLEQCPECVLAFLRDLHVNAPGARKSVAITIIGTKPSLLYQVWTPGIITFRMTILNRGPPP
jgi:hypothetical protein